MTASLPRMSITRKQSPSLCRVLIVARNPELRRLLQYILNETRGYASDCIATEAEAFSYITQRSYQMLIYDTDRFEDAAGLRALAASAASTTSHQAKTVVLTSYGPFDQEYEVLTDTFDLCFNKPFSQYQLLDRLNRLSENGGR